MPEGQGGISCVTRQRLSYSDAVLIETVVHHGVRAEKRGAFTSRSQDATAVVLIWRVKVKGWIARFAPRAAEARRRWFASLLAAHPRGRYGGRTVIVGGGGHMRGGEAQPPAQGH